MLPPELANRENDNASVAAAPEVAPGPSGRILRQKMPRYPTDIKVHCTDGTGHFWNAANLSEGGAFLVGAPILPPSSRLNISFGIPTPRGPQKISVLARVAWTNRAEAHCSTRLPFGMGLQFLELDAESRQLLHDYLTRKREDGQVGADQISPGTILGSYRVLQLLGTGGMGSVYLAEHVVLGRRVALKRLHPRFAQDPGIVRRFFTEAKVVNQIGHQHIVEITDFVSTGDVHFFVMELLQGRALSSLQDQQGALPLSQVLTIATQLCDALQAAHEAGVIHRDLKPENIFLVGDPDHSIFVKLLDFGIAKLTETAGAVGMERTAAGLILGTPGYIAPEQFLEGTSDARSDIYALGVLLFQMVTGTRPFVADTWPQMLHMHATRPPPRLKEAASRREYPADLEALILECLAKTPKERPQSMAEIKNRLLSLQGQLDRQDTLLEVDLADMIAGDEMADETPPAPSVSRSGQSSLHRWRWLVGGMAASLLIGGTTMGVAHWLDGAPAAMPGGAAAAETTVAIEAEAVPAPQTSEAADSDAPSPVTTEPPMATTASGATAKPDKPNRAVKTSKPAKPGSASGKRANRTSVSKPASHPAPTPSPSAQQNEVKFRLSLVRQLVRQRDFRAAIPLCREILTLEPKNASAYRNLGIAYAGLSATGPACEAYRRYLRFAPTAPDRGQVEKILGSCP